MHMREGEAPGFRYLYRLIDLTALGLDVEALPGLLTAAERMGFDGLNITHPCKQPVRPEHWVSDIVYFPLETAFLASARAKGCRVLSGGGMAVYQAVEAFRLFTGAAPEAERMAEHFRQMTAG